MTANTETPVAPAPTAAPPPGTVAVRLLGEPSLAGPGGERRRFESQAVRLLLAYLADRPGAPVTRERLAGLLWPEETAERGLHNLRQALYVLRRGLAGNGTEPLATDRRQAAIVTGHGCWLDWQVFEEAARRGRAGGAGAPRDLEVAAALYRGPFLADVVHPAAEELLAWLRQRQERLRETSLDVLDALVAHHAGRGEHAQALERARRRAELDPASAEARGQVVRLSVAAGERPRGEAGAAGTTLPPPGAGAARAGLAPLLPLVGRDDMLERLTAAGAAAFAGPARCSVLTGPPGSGRSRLVHTALARLLADGRRGRVLRASAPPWAGLVPWAGLRDLVASLPPGDRNRTGGVVPTFPWTRSGQPAAGESAGETDAGEALTALAGRLVRRRPLVDPVPLALVVDDAGAWDGGSLAAVARAAAALADQPLWLIVVAGPEGPPPPFDAAPLPAERLDLPPLAPRHALEASQELLGAGDGARLAEWLSRPAGGLPLHLVEAVRLLADHGGLAAAGPRWRLVALDVEPPRDLDEAVARRAALLPASARHLLPLAAAAGPRVEVSLLVAAADEDPRVVDVALGVLIERGFLRQAAGPWKPLPGPRDPELWHGGARRGRLAIDHGEVARRLLAGLGEDETAAVAAALAGAAALAPPSAEHDALLLRHGGAAGAAFAGAATVTAAARRLLADAAAAGDAWTAERLRRAAL